MKSIRKALLIAATALVIMPALADAQDRDHRPDGNRNGSRESGRGSDNSPMAAPPQAQRPPQAPQAPRAQSASSSMQVGNEGWQHGNWNGGNRPVDTGAARTQWQANRGQENRGPGNRDQAGRDQGNRDQGNRGDNRPGNPGGNAVQYNQDRGQWTRNGQPQFNGDPRNGRGNDYRHDGDRRGGNDNRNGNDRRWGNGNDNRPWDGNHDRGGNRYNNGRNDHRPDTNWRNDRRYDWRGWRSSHGSLFRGRYNAPHGYGYRSIYRGFFLEPFFYGSNYWLSDPYQYRLPPVEWPYRWVRYYDDAVLVDTTNGEVVDVIQGFFF